MRYCGKSEAVNVPAGRIICKWNTQSAVNASQIQMIMEIKTDIFSLKAVIHFRYRFFFKVHRFTNDLQKVMVKDLS